MSQYYPTKVCMLLGRVDLSWLNFVRMGTPSQKRFNRGEGEVA
ncbi:hypothetical protein VCR4J2_250680 [Vibrio coralliirubri]|nr:hypothetical protein VCR4J2_250680 [Vibrio coralliirubri]